MCGIFGLVGKSGTPAADLVERLTDLVAHRGPDGRGTYLRESVALGHRRLAIIDTSDAGHQPMRHPIEDVCITYNGEVYNYIELRTELELLGHTFRSRTDTEVILAAYLEWGTDCVRRFNGMWAIAILDWRNKTLFCSRDRFGVKPFHYVETARWFAFGSEIPQLLPICERRTAERSIVLDYLVSGLSDHTPATFFRPIMKLRAGHNLIYDLSRHRHKISCYYEFRPAAVSVSLQSSSIEEFASLLQDAVRLRLRSDVQVGTCLSGGLDSSSVATIAAALRPKDAGPFAAITAVSEQHDNSEEGYARQVVESAGLWWLKVRPDYDDFTASLSDVIECQAEPFGGPSVCMQYFVMKAARHNGIPVLLDGQGGDESLSGYERHYAGWLQELFRKEGLFGVLRGTGKALAHNGNLSRVSLAGMLLGSFWPRMIERRMVPRMRGARFQPKLPRTWRDYIERVGDAVATQRADVEQTSLPMLLRFEDRNSMRHSVEARLPFLDYRLMEFTLAMPLQVKMRNGWTKWPLRQAMRERMTSDIIWRRNKLGFEAPDRTWLARHQEIMFDAVKRSEMLRVLFENPWLMATYPSLPKSLKWRLYCLAAWERQFGAEGLA